MTPSLPSSRCHAERLMVTLVLSFSRTKICLHYLAQFFLPARSCFVILETNCVRGHRPRALVSLRLSRRPPASYRGGLCGTAFACAPLCAGGICRRGSFQRGIKISSEVATTPTRLPRPSPGATSYSTASREKSLRIFFSCSRRQLTISARAFRVPVWFLTLPERFDPLGRFRREAGQDTLTRALWRDRLRVPKNGLTQARRGKRADQNGNRLKSS